MPVGDRQAQPTSSADYFDRVAADYASWYEARSPGGHAMRVRQSRILELLDQPEGRVLDVGCGPGILAGELLRRGYQVWGLDASPQMIAQCRARFRGVRGAHFLVGDAARLPFADGRFDAVTCTGVIDRLPAHAAAIAEMTRVLRAGGTLMISFPNLLSPYALWRTWVFYPAVAWLGPLYHALTRRSRPPSLAASFVRLYTERSAGEHIVRCGATITGRVYFNFNVFLSPLDELFPRWASGVAERLETLRRGAFRWLGAGFILRARRRQERP